MTVVQLLDWVNKDAFYAAIESKKTGEFMGTTCIWVPSPKNREGMITVGLLPCFMGKGYSSEALGWVVDYAFRWLALHRVSLSVFHSNKESISSYEKMCVFHLSEGPVAEQRIAGDLCLKA